MRLNADPGVKIVLLLNKSDSPNKELNYSEAKQYADNEGMDVYETSAKTGKNVNTVFTDLCRYLIVTKGLDMRNNGGSNLTTKNHNSDENQEKTCCG